MNQNNQQENIPFYMRNFNFFGVYIPYWLLIILIIIIIIVLVFLFMGSGSNEVYKINLLETQNLPGTIVTTSPDIERILLGGGCGGQSSMNDWNDKWMKW